MADDDKQLVISVENLSKTFKLPHEKTGSIKSLLLSFRKRRTYEAQQALKSVSFEVNKGDFFGIVGRNGSGKSTLLKLLAGIYTPTGGTVKVNGSLTPFIELGVGFNPELTGRENIFLNGALLGFSRKEIAAMYKEIVDFAELERFMDQKLKNYSSGMQVRLAFSIAIKAKGDILMLDEVLAVGDAAFQQKCYDYFEKLKAEKKTVVFVTHDMAAVTRFCNRAIYIKDGKLIKNGSPDDIAEKYKLENIEAPTLNKQQAAQLSNQYTIAASIAEQTAKNVRLQFAYSSKQKEDLYIGFSILKEGISIAEMTTSLEKPLRGSGKVSYTLDTSVLNPGVYQVNVVLCLLGGRKLLSVSEEPIKFTVKGHIDPTRGAAIKLPDTWQA